VCAMLVPLTSGMTAGDNAGILQDTLLRWTGGDVLPAEGVSLPKIVEPELGSNSELQFSGNEFMTVPMPASDLGELTIALYIKPVVRDKTEHLVSCRSGVREDGFVLYNLHTNWGFSGGNGEVFEQKHLGVRSGFLTINEWQHIAVTFRKGAVKYYRNGALIAEHRLSIEEIRLLSNSGLRIGGGGVARDRTVAGFTGRMAGIVVIPKCVEEDAISELMAATNP